MERSRLKKLFLFTYTLALLFHLVLLWFGLASVLTTALLYTAFFLLSDLVAQKIVIESPLLRNIRFSIWVLCFALLLSEFTLKYLFKTHLTYNEKSGSFFYVSPYRQILHINLLKKYAFNQQDVRLYIQPFDSLNEFTPEFQYTHYYNEFGLRDRNYSNAEIDTSVVFLALGDSFTEGVGAPQDSTWAKQLEQLLQDKPTAFGKNVVCVNAGTNGSDLFYEWYKLKNLLLPAFSPRYVLLNVNATDINDVAYRGGMERFVSKNKVVYRQAPWWEYFYAFSFIARNIAHGIFHIEPNLFTRKNYQTEEQQAVEGICNCLLHDYTALAKQHSFRLLVIFSPIREQDILSNEINPFIHCKEQLTANGVSCLDLTQAFTGYKENIHEFFWQFDGHNNSRGYAIWAQEIYNVLAQDTTALKP